MNVGIYAVSRLVADAVRTTAERWNGFRVVGTTDDPCSVSSLARECDVLIVEHANSEARTQHEILETIVRVTRESCSPVVVVIGVPRKPAIVLRYLEVGASGYLFADETSDKLCRAVELAVSQAIELSPGIANQVVSRVTEMRRQLMAVSAEPVSEPGLTPRQREILELIEQGYTNKEIADKLYIQVGTVKNHVHNVLRKLNVRNRNEAVARLALVGSDFHEWLMSADSERE